MRKEDKLILEALKNIQINLREVALLIKALAEKNNYTTDFSFNISEIEELLNPKSQEMPFKDTLKEKSKKKKRKRLISKKAIKKFFDA